VITLIAGKIKVFARVADAGVLGLNSTKFVLPVVITIKPTARVVAMEYGIAHGSYVLMLLIKTSVILIKAIARTGAAAHGFGLTHVKIVTTPAPPILKRKIVRVCVVESGQIKSGSPRLLTKHLQLMF
jgi:hypothetical protein